MEGAAKLANELFVCTAEKGNRNVDREKINEIVMSLTASSAFTKEKLAHHAEAKRWAVEARAKIDRWDRRQRSVAEHEVRQAKFVTTERTCCVVDFDMFFAAVEIKNRPELADKPVAVGGPGMISTANYVARQWGVRSAMPGWIGQELCRRGPEFGMPAAELVLVRPNYEKYAEVAEIARSIFKEYDPNFRSYSLDEAYLDLTGKDGERALAEIRARVFAATQLTMSGGIGPNFRLAKIAADVNKPNGQFCVGSVPDFLRRLPCRKVAGVGRVLEQKLKEAFDVETCGDLLEAMPQIYHCFPPKARRFLHSVALGVQEEDPNECDERKGLGHERTFRATNDKEALRAKLAELCELTETRLKEHNLHPLKCGLKLKRDDFRVFTRTASSDARPVHTRLFAKLAPLLDAELATGDSSFRLLGVRAFDFQSSKATQSDVEAFFTSKKNTTSASSWRAPTASQVDRAVLDELPADVRDELRTQITTTVPTSSSSKKKMKQTALPSPPTKQPRLVFFERRPPDAEALAVLVSMGFSETRAAAALQRAPGSDGVSGAIELLLAESPSSSSSLRPAPAVQKS